MKKNKKEKFIFGLLMAITMVYGMEVYNAIIRTRFSINTFILPFGEFFLITIIVILLQKYLGGPTAQFIIFKIFKIKPSSKFFSYIVSISMVFIMCPIMSLVATLLFKPINNHIFITWLNTFKVNFPMAFIWQLFIAGPFVRFLSTKISYIKF